MKAAIYSRKSKFTGKGESIGNQIQMCKEHANTFLKDKNITEFLIYEDEGFSGGNTNRPEFQRLLVDAKLKKFDVLICYRLDRISRNVADFSSTLETLQKHNVDFISIREQFDTTSPMGRAMIYIASVFSQLERETIAERIKDNMLELSKTGRWLGGNTPIGYASEPITYIDENMNEKKLVKLKQVPEELKIVSLLYNKYLELNSLSKIQTYALQSKLKTKRGADFTKANIRLVLANPVYVKANDEVAEYLESQGISVYGVPDGKNGFLTYNKSKNITTVNGKTAMAPREKSEWIATMSSQKGIIEPGDWIAVQRLIEENKGKFPNEGKSHNALLSGKIRCAKCGGNMVVHHGHLSVSTGKTNYYYSCAMKDMSKKSRCDNKNALVSEIDDIIVKELKELAKDKTIILAEIIKQNKNSKKNDASINKETYIKKSIEEKEVQIDNLVTKLSLTDDMGESLFAKMRDLKKEIASLKKDLESIKNLKVEFDDKELDLSFIKLLLDSCSIIDTLAQYEIKQLIQYLAEKITWNGDDHSVDINFIGSDNSKKKQCIGNHL